MTLDEGRQAALALPETTEAPHHDKTSFRVMGRIFATASPDGEHLHVFVDEHTTHALVAENPTIYEELWWGRKLSGLRVCLLHADPREVEELLAEAWRRKAPARLVP